MVNEFPQVLTIAGSDSDGSAGMEADMNTFQRRGVHGMSVMTAVVAGNSYAIQASHLIPTDFVEKQFKVLAEDFKIRASKTGMLADSAMIKTVVANYSEADFGPLLVDPVIITKHGDMLLEESAFETLKTELIPLATLITPNFYEAIKLTGIDIKSDADTIEAAHKLQALGAKNVMLKGSHSDSTQSEVRDFVLLEDGSSFWLSEPYVDTNRVNGTGDVLSACIVAEIAKGTPLPDAIRLAKKFVTAAIAHPIEVGHKFGPVNHLVDFQA